MPRRQHRATTPTASPPRAANRRPNTRTGSAVTMLACAALLTAGTLAGAAPVTAAWTGTNGRIAYDHLPSGGETSIWSSNPDGTDPGPIPFDDSGFEPDSFLGVNSPEWAPDGRHLVASLNLNCDYTGGAPCGNEIGWVDTVTGAVRQLTCDGVVAAPNTHPECFSSQYGGVPSPDGTTVAFITDRMPNLIPAGSILTVPVTRSCGHNICSGPFTALTNDPEATGYSTLSWSPDGNHLLAMRSTAGHDELVTVATDGSGTWTSLTGDLPATYTEPRWSPDGSHVMVSSGGTGLYTFGVSCTSTGCARTSDPAQFFTGSTRQADYAPDGTHAVLTRPFGDGSTGAEIWTVSLTGVNQDLARVTTWTAGAAAQHPSWQPVNAAPDPLTITAVTPADGSSATAKAGVTVSATFNRAAATANLTLAVMAKNGRTTPVAGTASCTTGCTTLTFTPKKRLGAGTYRATVTGTGTGGPATRSWQFTLTSK